MPDASDSVVSLPADGEREISFGPVPASTAWHTSSSATRALVDGLGLYTACGTSPFLTAPTASNAPSPSREFAAAIDSPDALANRLAGLTEVLRRAVQGIPVRPRLSEEEVAGLVTVVLEVVARHLALAHADGRRSH